MFSFFHFFMALSVLSLNCNGIRDASKRAGLLHWVRSLPVRPDIICLQEGHCSSVQECSLWFQSSGFGVACSPGSVRSSGCAILFVTLCRFRTPGATQRGVTSNVSFLSRTSLFACAVCTSLTVIPPGTPFCTTFESKLTFLFPPCSVVISTRSLIGPWIGVAPIHRTRLKKVLLPFCGLFDACSVVDIFRYLHPSTPGFTWSRWNGALASRIDLVSIPSQWVSSVSACPVVPCPFSDHCGAQVSVMVPNIILSGPGLWKLNTAVSKDVEYVRLISEFWQAWCGSMDNFSSLAKWWDAGKSRLKGLTIRY